MIHQFYLENVCYNLNMERLIRPLRWSQILKYINQLSVCVTTDTDYTSTSISIEGTQKLESIFRGQSIYVLHGCRAKKGLGEEGTNGRLVVL